MAKNTERRRTMLIRPLMMKVNALCITITMAAATAACAQQHAENQQKLQQMDSAAQQLVLLNNGRLDIPLTKLETKRIASVNTGIGDQNYKILDSMLNKYAKVSRVAWQSNLSSAALLARFKSYNTVIFAVDDSRPVKPEFIWFIKELAKTRQVILNVYGNGATLAKFTNKNIPVVYSPFKVTAAYNLSAQAIFGGIGITGRLTADAGKSYKRGEGYNTLTCRLKYTLPEELGINSDALREIDAIAAEAVAKRAAPGMVVLAAKNGKVFFNKAYGTHTYLDNSADKITDIFDLASITKTAATTPEVMRLADEGKLNLDSTIGHYIAGLKASPMYNIPLRDVMLHQAGFIPYIAFQNYVKPEDHSTDSSNVFSVRVADNYYVKPAYYKQYMWPTMVNSPIKTPGKYVYSDISMYVMREVVEHITGKPLNKLVQEDFYKPLGMQTAGFNPRDRFNKSEIIPTENDTYFRHQLLVGDVHDQGAALAGGVSGHAGLFSTANDLAILYTMYMNRGTYGNKQYISSNTVNTFISKQSDVSRRGLGFDRYDADSKMGYPSALAGPNTFGHTGYTGTCVWADPDNGLLYIFLSNRVNPTVTDRLSDMRIRPRIQDVFYKALQQ